jgi:S-methylmethionine-dependent homocysteine/selenocysteine methylase
METWLQYIDGFELKHFCLFDLLNDPKAVVALRDYHRKVIEAVLPHGFGVIVEGLHYRASRDWGALIGYSPEGLAEINIRGIEFYKGLAQEYETDENPMPIGGVLGPRGDAYNTGRTPDASEAEDYHSEQIETFKRAGADMVTAATFSSVYEAIGVARAAKSVGMPLVISFISKEQGRLSTGPTVREAIEQIDAATGASPIYYMINCSHPLEFEPALVEGEWLNRLGGFMPNAVAMNKLALCTLGHLEDGDPEELGRQMGDLSCRFPHITVWGGCCGTDSRHLGQICMRVREAREQIAAQ